MHLVDQAVAKILLNDVDSSTDANILAICSIASLSKGGSNALSNKVEDCSSFHDQRRARVVGQHEDWDVIDRIFALPTSPALIWPGSTDRPEHVSAENPSTNVLKAASGKVFINASCSPIFTEQILLKRAQARGQALQAA